MSTQDETDRIERHDATIFALKRGREAWLRKISERGRSDGREWATKFREDELSWYEELKPVAAMIDEVDDIDPDDIWIAAGYSSAEIFWADACGDDWENIVGSEYAKAFVEEVAGIWAAAKKAGMEA